MRTWKWFSVLAVVMLVVAACGQQGGTSESAEASEPAGSEPAASEGPAYEGMSYPEDGPAECGAEADDTHDAYTGNIEQIRAEDEFTVVFDLCNPDVAFLSKIAFASFAINDSDYLEANVEDGTIIEQPNGTGPYSLENWVTPPRVITLTPLPLTRLPMRVTGPRPIAIALRTSALSHGAKVLFMPT